LIFIFSFVLLPGRNSDPEVVRKEYVRQILKYEGTPYVYGGEDRRGIDCSGLVRCGLLNANFICGISTLNSSLIREGIFLWWHDASAKELKEGYRNKTSPLFTAAGLGEIDYALMKPGDLAIKADGTHVLVFIGERTWMEADPDKMVVTKFTVTEQNKANYNSPIQIVRWKQLEN
jgi:cell wall-associated NlpC family hydrolase